MNKKEFRRTVTLSQQLSKEPESPSNLPPTRQPTGHWDGVTVRSASGRTLFDIIQQDDNWKPVKDRLRLQRVGAAFSDSATVGKGAPSSLIIDGGGSKMLPGGATSFKRNPTLARTISRSVSVRPTTLAQPMGEIVITEITDITDEISDELEEEPAKGEVSMKGGVSLMSLLEQTNNHWGEDELAEVENDEDLDEENGEEEEGEEVFYVCCICMVRHKGAAFVPCGHTFCRLCSRELWVSNGNCPLCNSFVREILNIF